MKQARVVMGGGNRSSKLLLNPNELTKLPNVVVVVGLAKPGSVARKVAQQLESSHSSWKLAED